MLSSKPFSTVPGNSMQHIGASTHMLKSESQTSLNRRKDSFSGDRDRASAPPKTVTGWEEVPRGKYYPECCRLTVYLSACVICEEINHSLHTYIIFNFSNLHISFIFVHIVKFACTLCNHKLT